ncbi:MAG: hypothetical protein ACYT04_68165, partial [Nostoc sp.]
IRVRGVIPTKAMPTAACAYALVLPSRDRTYPVDTGKDMTFICCLLPTEQRSQDGSSTIVAVPTHEP